jgi:hypothetical protein
MKIILTVAVAVLAIAVVPHTGSAQWISLGLRGSGGVPTGTFAEDQSSSSDGVVTAAKTGFGYGLEAGAGIGPIAAYAGFDHINFDCEVTTCTSNGSYTLQGVNLGLMYFGHAVTIVRPFLKGGVTFNKLEGDYGSSSNGLTSDRAPGYEVGIGAVVSLGGLVGLVPQVRYVGQNLKVKVPGVTSPNPDGQGVNYFQFDIGLAFHSPYGFLGH